MLSNALQQIYKCLHWISTVRFHTKAFSITELIFNYATIERPVTKTTPTVGMPLSCRFLPDIDGTKSANETGILFCFSLARVYFLLSLYYIVILNL